MFYFQILNVGTRKIKRKIFDVKFFLFYSGLSLWKCRTCRTMLFKYAHSTIFFSKLVILRFLWNTQKKFSFNFMIIYLRFFLTFWLQIWSSLTIIKTIFFQKQILLLLLFFISGEKFVLKPMKPILIPNSSPLSTCF